MAGVRWWPVDREAELDAICAALDAALVADHAGDRLVALSDAAVALEVGAGAEAAARVHEVIDAGHPWGATVLTVEELLGQPSRRLAVYGTLAPGRGNHAHVAALDGDWEPARLRGELEWLTEDVPRLRWRPGAATLAGWLLSSDDLPASWPRLDDLEGPAYRRGLVPVEVSARLTVATCYVDAGWVAGGPGGPGRPLAGPDR